MQASETKRRSFLPAPRTSGARSGGTTDVTPSCSATSTEVRTSLNLPPKSLSSLSRMASEPAKRDDPPATAQPSAALRFPQKFQETRSKPAGMAEDGAGDSHTSTDNLVAAAVGVESHDVPSKKLAIPSFIHANPNSDNRRSSGLFRPAAGPPVSVKKPGQTGLKLAPKSDENITMPVDASKPTASTKSAATAASRDFAKKMGPPLSRAPRATAPDSGHEKPSKQLLQNTFKVSDTGHATIEKTKAPAGKQDKNDNSEAFSLQSSKTFLIADRTRILSFESLPDALGNSESKLPEVCGRRGSAGTIDSQRLHHDGKPNSVPSSSKSTPRHQAALAVPNVVSLSLKSQRSYVEGCLMTENEFLASSDGSLGILDENELLDSSLLPIGFGAALVASAVLDSARELEPEKFQEPESISGRSSSMDERTISFSDPVSEPSESSCVLRQKPDGNGMRVAMEPAGCQKTEASESDRPLSVVSIGSTDTGIMTESTSQFSLGHERPSSYLSTSSADTGYQVDECDALMTLSVTSAFDVQQPMAMHPTDDDDTTASFSPIVITDGALITAAASTTVSDCTDLPPPDLPVSKSLQKGDAGPAVEEPLVVENLQMESQVELLEVQHKRPAHVIVAWDDITSATSLSSAVTRGAAAISDSADDVSCQVTNEHIIVEPNECRQEEDVSVENSGQPFIPPLFLEIQQKDDHDDRIASVETGRKPEEKTTANDGQNLNNGKRSKTVPEIKIRPASLSGKSPPKPQPKPSVEPVAKETAANKRAVTRLFSDSARQASSKKQPPETKGTENAPKKSGESFATGASLKNTTIVISRSSTGRASVDLGHTSRSSAASSVHSGGMSSALSSESKRSVTKTTAGRTIPKQMSLGSIKRGQRAPAASGSKSPPSRASAASGSKSPPSRASAGSKTPSETNLTAIGELSTCASLATTFSLRTSTPLPASSANSVGRSSAAGSPRTESRLGSMSDVSSPPASLNDSCALSSSSVFHSPRNALSRAKTSSSATTATARKIGPSRPGGMSELQKSGSLSARSTGGISLAHEPPVTVRKAIGIKRGSIVESSTRPPLPNVRRASVATVQSTRSGANQSAAAASQSRVNAVGSATAGGSRGNISARSSASATSSVDKSPRNKISAAGQSASFDRGGPVRRIRQSLQPDVVSDSIFDEQASSEIGRLEAVCESRAKDLARVTNELREKTKWFEAMALVVQYLTGQLDTGACRKLTSRLEEAMVQLKEASRQLEELTRQRDALIAEIQSVKAREEEERAKLNSAHQMALMRLEAELNEEKEEAVKRAINQHIEELSIVETNYEHQMAELHEQCDELLAGKDMEMSERLAELAQQHAKNLADLQTRHDEQLEEFSQKFELVKVTFSEKVEFLRSEGEELRRREKTYQEACQRDSELRVQAALASYAHLPQEIDSLKTVLELRNNELHELRLRSMETQREMEELLAARDTIKRLQQKVENLEAIINIRQDYEKQLTEKHQQLLRKYERESKANKRLSMDKEELMWRLTQSDVTPDSLRRSVSHSPTSDLPTPGAIGLTPVPSIPPLASSINTRPASGRSVAPSSESAAAVKLRRSGTYDLLNQEFTGADEDEDLVFDRVSK